MKKLGFHIIVISLALAGLHSDRSAAQSGDPICPTTAPPVNYGTGTLDTATEAKNGATYSEKAGIGNIILALEGGNIQPVFPPPVAIPEPVAYAAAADFDGDGFDDYVGGQTSGDTNIYRNFTFNYPLDPMAGEDWGDPFFVRRGEFQNVRALGADPGGNFYMVLAAGDFDGDGRPDIFRANTMQGSAPASAKLFLNAGNDAMGNPDFDPPYDAMDGGTPPSDLGIIKERGTNVVVVDYNGDRKLDLLVGSGETNGGSIRIFLNTCTLVTPVPLTAPPAPAPLPCANLPAFSYAGALIENMGMGDGNGEMPAFAYADFDGDRVPDLVAGSPNCCADPTLRLRMWRGVLGGGLDPTPQSIDSEGAVTAVLAYDVSFDGRTDIIVSTDNEHFGTNLGGQGFYYRNNSSSTPFSDPNFKFLTHGFPSDDTDIALVLDYDGDPEGRRDFIFGGGPTANEFGLYANRPYDFFVACGDVYSEVVDLGPLAGAELIVDSARIEPTQVIPADTAITWYASNEEPPNWTLANPCADNSAHQCVNFVNPVGNEVRWRAVLCADPPYYIGTPQISSIKFSFNYTQVRDSFRSGIIVHDGVAYLPALRQPGDRGRLYAKNALLTTDYWEASAKLDVMSDSARNIYTAATDGTTRLDFRVTGSPVNDTALLATLTASNLPEADALIDWVRSARFGVGVNGVTPTRLGAIESSVPTLVTKPTIPPWYSYGGADDRRAIDEFISAYQNRIPLIVFGAKDGMIHAIRNQPTSITDPRNGDEVWAFVPAKVASRMLADWTTSLSNAKTTVAAYPDGSPSHTIARIGSQFRSVIVMGSGNGGKSLTALDVTNTIDPATDTVFGPTPLWHATPGEANAGQGHSKPAILRVKIGGSERFISVAGTGAATDNLVPPYTKGRIVSAYDVSNGDLLWQFEALCPVTSDITGYETDDEVNTRIDGFADRVAFADKCGNVYKLDPSKDLNGGWNINSGLGGTIPAGTNGGQTVYALFSTVVSAPDNPLVGQERPIANNIGAYAVAERTVLYFGTGGQMDYDQTKENAFYGIYADTGEIVQAITGGCPDICYKFYSGVLILNDEVVFAKTKDSQTLGPGTCIPAESEIYKAALDLSSTFDQTPSPIGGVVGSLSYRSGAIFVPTLDGVVTIGTPTATDAGDETAGGASGGSTTEGSLKPLVLMGWRQIF